jgi:ATP-binding cassette subfamily F protein 3
MAVAFAKPERSGKVIFELEDARLEVPGRTLLDGAELWLERGEHVSLVGPNGAGKTTLIETLAGGRELPAGKLRRGHNVKLGVLSQHAEELGAAGSVLEATQQATRLTPNKARALLGRFLFSGEQAEKPLEGLSGGERRRLSLAILVASGANVLILDEPTNHLDVESREALEEALLAFEGSLLLVSHDRALLAAVGTRTVAIEDRALRSYAGGFAEYVRAREAAASALAAGERERGSARAAARKGGGARRAASGREQPERGGASKLARAAEKRQRAAARERASLEAEVERAERALAAIEDELSDPSAWSDPERAARAGERHEAARRAVQQLYARWEKSVS